MDHLFPCRTCQRHVRAGSTTCPFCGDSLAQAPEPAVEPPRGISRSAMLAFGAALAGSTAFGCGTDVETGSSAGGGGHGGETAASAASSTASSSSASGSGTGGHGGGSGGHGGGHGGGAGGHGGIGGAGGGGGTGNIQPPYGSPPVDGGP